MSLRTSLARLRRSYARTVFSGGGLAFATTSAALALWGGYLQGWDTAPGSFVIIYGFLITVSAIADWLPGNDKQ